MRRIVLPAPITRFTVGLEPSPLLSPPVSLLGKKRRPWAQDGTINTRFTVGGQFWPLPDYQL